MDRTDSNINIDLDDAEVLLHETNSTGRLNLSTRNLSGLNLAGANLSKVDLSNADLSRANLRDADLRGTDLRKADLHGADLRGANLREANLSQADLRGARISELDLSGLDLGGADLREIDFSAVNLRGANLSEAVLSDTILNKITLNTGLLRRADLSRADLSRADLQGTNLSRADLSEANLQGADLRGTDLRRANLSQANLKGANLSGSLIYAISAWDVQLENTMQLGLIITESGEATVTVDNLEVAQFINLLLTNKKIRDIIDAVARKAVLILGRFTPERKAVLDALREALRTHGYVPILFDFDKPSSRNFTETMRTLAHLSRFIIADLTDPSSIPQELQATIPTLVVPVQPVLLEGKREYAMFVDFLKAYHWVLPIHYYTDQEHLLASLQAKVIEPAEQKAQELTKR